MTARLLVGLIVACVYAVLAMLHMYWALGGHWGSSGTVPELRGVPTFRPSRTSTWLVAFALFSASALVLFGARVLPWPLSDGLLHLALYVLGGVFALRAIGDFRLIGFFKRVRGTRFARLDSFVFSPLCTALSAGVLWLA
jgi:hypothetical protein